MRRRSTLLATVAAILAGMAPPSHAGSKLLVLAQDSALIPPSEAVNQALAAVPDGTPLDVQLKGNRYLVKLKTGNKVRVVRVDAVTGAVSP